MGHYAKVVDGKVVEVIVAQQDFIDQYHSGETWIKTSYNTRGGVHYLPNDPDSPPENKITPSPDQSKALRKIMQELVIFMTLKEMLSIKIVLMRLGH